MVGVLCDQHLREQPGGGDALGDDLRRDWHLCAGPLAADVALYREYARCVVQLLADALECKAARAAGVLGLVVAVHSR